MKESSATFMHAPLYSAATRTSFYEVKKLKTCVLTWFKVYVWTIGGDTRT